MELKTYQQLVMADLRDYLQAVDRTNDVAAAWGRYWADKDVAVDGDLFGVPPYHNDIPGVPHVCMKVPTGGGKTYLACCAAKRIFTIMPPVRPKVLVWLVPSDAILTQTVKNLSNPNHPYRQRLNADFNGRVEVYEKDQLLNGQNFSPDTVREVLSVCVLSFSSLRIDSKKKDDRKVFQENGNLLRFAQEYDEAPELADTPDTALMNVLRQFTPVVVVDESHNAKSKLSVQMLQNLNPGFVLDLTATPAANANIISYVKALDLKKEYMVKLPVFVYNRADRTSVLRDAIQIRGRLENLAKAEQKRGGRPIRPIALFQAQPKTDADNETFDKLKETLLKWGIPEEQIAIKTSGRDEIGKTDLLAADCPIRYVITVNALKEGWDCPFAYVLASLANKTSQTDVEQIVGRILRQPYAQKSGAQALNASYVLSCSADFQHTIESVVKGLNESGFSKADYRAPAAAAQTVTMTPVAPPNVVNSAPVEQPAPVPMADPIVVGDSFSDIEVPATPENAGESNESTVQPAIEELFSEVTKAADAYDQATDTTPDDGTIWLTPELPAAKPVTMNPVFKDEVERLKIPQFFIKTEADMFGEGKDLLSPENLTEGFSLSGADAHIDFSFSFDQAGAIDVEEGDGVPKYKQLSVREREYIAKMMAGQSEEHKIDKATDLLYGLVNKFNDVKSSEIRPYVRRVLESLNKSDLDALDQVLPVVADRIREKIDGLKADHCFKRFKKGLDSSEIDCEPSYTLPFSIAPANATDLLAKSLYGAEYADMTSLEEEAIKAIAGLDNIKWWHRIRDRKGFCLNGFINHYPDFMVMTHSGNLVLVETKGDYLDNSDSKRKLELGRAWQNATNARFKYFMVFKDRDVNLEGAYQLGEFLEVLKGL